MDNLKEQGALTFTAVLMAFGFCSVPSWRGWLLDVCHHAAVAGVVTLALLFVTPRLGARGIAIERVWAALFLAGMPVVYIISWFVTGRGGANGAWLWVEILGFPLYAGLAFLGLKRSPWFLVAGIAAHGIGCDAWHYVETAYIPTWYVTACLLADVGLSIYLAVRVPAWRAWRYDEGARTQQRTL